MYLSRVEIDTKNRYKTKDLTHLGAYHHWVESSFPAAVKAGERPRHLWRLDTLAGKQYLLVVSAEKPDSTELQRYGVSGTVITKSYDRFLAAIQSGEIMQFRLTANPTHSIIGPEKRRRIVPHVTVARQRQWLIDRAGRLGFELIMQESADAGVTVQERAFDIVGRDWPVRHEKKGPTIRFSRVTFEGILQVTDATVFRQTLVKGIGREKAFGMGLMTVIPTI